MYRNRALQSHNSALQPSNSAPHSTNSTLQSVNSPLPSPSIMLSPLSRHARAGEQLLPPRLQEALNMPMYAMCNSQEEAFREGWLMCLKDMKESGTSARGGDWE